MYTTHLKISEFLEIALAASQDTGYEAFLILAARSADGRFLQDEVIDNWSSFHDLTNDLILVLTSSQQRHNNTPVATGYKFGFREVADRTSGLSIKTSGLSIETSGLSIGESYSPKWKHAIISRSRSYSLPYGIYRPLLRRSAAQERDALTLAASDVVRFFGLSEAWLPCVVILSHSDRQQFIVVGSTSFSLYDLVKRIIADYEPTASAVRTLRALIHQRTKDLRITEGQLAGLEREEKSTGILVKEQLWGICQLLSYCAEIYPACVPLAHQLRDWFEGNASEPLDVHAIGPELVRLVGSGVDSGQIEDSIYRKLRKRLPRAILSKSGAKGHPVFQRLHLLADQKSFLQAGINTAESGIRCASTKVYLLTEAASILQVDCTSSRAYRSYLADPMLDYSPRTHLLDGWTTYLLSTEASVGNCSDSISIQLQRLEEIVYQLKQSNELTTLSNVQGSTLLQSYKALYLELRNQIAKRVIGCEVSDLGARLSLLDSTLEAASSNSSIGEASAYGLATSYAIDIDKVLYGFRICLQEHSRRLQWEQDLKALESGDDDVRKIAAVVARIENLKKQLSKLDMSAEQVWQRIQEAKTTSDLKELYDEWIATIQETSR